ncbi:hypothetical protein [Nocardia sp. SYP-A9097]|uniref:hypothetical protein n=1 Tax=Nocardia sp. SYP-A9097 TaxID=2663237 RepID=UPI00129B53AA|nr:hypothetical protein [Nocardia sp. SYP-A9097]
MTVAPWIVRIAMAVPRVSAVTGAIAVTVAISIAAVLNRAMAGRRCQGCGRRRCRQ